MDDKNVGGQHGEASNAFRLQVETLVAQGKLTPEEAADLLGEGAEASAGPVDFNKPPEPASNRLSRPSAQGLRCPTFPASRRLRR